MAVVEGVLAAIGIDPTGPIGAAAGLFLVGFAVFGVYSAWQGKK